MDDNMFESDDDQMNFRDEDSVQKKIANVEKFTSVIQSRVLLAEAKVLNAHETAQSSSMTQGALDSTVISSEYSRTTNDMWTVAQNIQLNTAIHNMFALNSVQHLDLPCLEETKRELVSNATELAKKLDELKDLCSKQEASEQKLLQLRSQALELFSLVEGKINREPTALKESSLRKLNRKQVKTKIARAMINCLLSSLPINYEEHPELADAIEKWRQPLDFD